MMSLMEGFQAAYRIPTGRPFLKQRAMSIFLVLIVAIPAIVASSLIPIRQPHRGRPTLRFRHWQKRCRAGTPLVVLGHILRYAIGFVTTVFVTGLLYYFAPNHRPEELRRHAISTSRIGRVWPGAILATVLWLATTLAFGWYVRHIANYNLFYGGVGTIIAMLIWMYLLSVIALVGCEYNAERERMDSLLSLY